MPVLCGTSADLTSVRNILLALEECWFESEDPEAIRCGHLLKSALSGELVAVPAPSDSSASCAPPSGLCLEGKSKESLNLFQILFQLWNKLAWSSARSFRDPLLEERIKEARLIGPRGPIKSDTIDVKISYVEPGTFVPRHSEEAKEMLQILEGDDIEIGLAVDDWLEKATYYVFPPTYPKVVRSSPASPFVAISVHTGKIGGKLWMNDEDMALSDKYPGVADCKGQVESYYDNIATDYSRAMRAWGYCMPELVSSALTEHGKLQPSDALKVVDLGCGDGAVGEALYKKGFTDITGVDISSGMIAIAEGKRVYRETVKANLMEPLPFEKETFDCCVTAAVTTYLEPDALEHWLPIVKKGGLMCIVHKASVWPMWTEEQEKLECCNVWKMVWYSEEPVPYLPSLDVKGTDRARIYIYKKL